MRPSNWRIPVFAAVKTTMNTGTLPLIAPMAAPLNTDTGTLQPAPVWTSVNSLQTANSCIAFPVALLSSGMDKPENVLPNGAFHSVVNCAWKINAIVQVLSENVNLFTQY